MCFRDVVRLSPKDRTRGNVPGDDGWANVFSAKKPKILDAIVAVRVPGEKRSTQELQERYTRRHKDTSCKGGCD
jgi:hypothetical protein